jgi:Gnt-I system low-affinity gluconate transporter
MDYQLLMAVLSGIGLLLLLIVRLQWPAFIALLLASITVGLMSGLPVERILKSVETGMGSTLGYVATIVGLGAIFGGILEKTQGSQVIAQRLIGLFGIQRASWAMAIAGYIIAIPVFFDVAFIILFPILGALQQKTGRSILYFALPLLAGLAVGHAFIPPTPGPIAVAKIIGADLGWVILIGILVGLPTTLIAGVWAGRFLADRIQLPIVAPPPTAEQETHPAPSAWSVFGIVFLPILLILFNTFILSDVFFVASGTLKWAAALFGHPFSALLISNVLAWYLLGRFTGWSTQDLSDVSAASFRPAGVIILLTGAGGVFKQVLVDTGAGAMLAKSAETAQIPIIIFAFLAAAIIRLLQGSATVAMATSASIIAPLILPNTLSQTQLAAIVMAIAAGASIMSHVNDSGFWLVKEYLGLTEKQTFQTWSLMTTVLALTGFVFAWVLYVLC